ncbi:MAG: NAD(P)-binding protein [Pirellulaceae bacterium]|nr:NAD(P)-binding protein [Pirellulaceae bacterium]
MVNLLFSPHFQLLFGLSGIGLLFWLIARWYPRQTRAVIREVDRWSGMAIIVLGMLVLICGIIGFGTQTTATSIPVALYETFQLFAFNIDVKVLNDSKSLMLQVAMVSAILLAATVAAKGIALLFHKSYVEMQLRLSSKHVVILGLGRIGRQLITDLVALKDSRTIIVIEPDENNPNLDWARATGAIVIVGDATKRESLEAAQIHRANEIFVVTGIDECNIECVIEVRDILQRVGRKDWIGRPREALRCYVHVLDRDLAEILRRKLKELEHCERLDVEVFNALERTARRLLEDIATTSLNGHPIRPVTDDQFAHIILMGFGGFGQTLALKLAELAHFENGKRMRMTIVDRDIEKKAQRFVARHPHFGPAFGHIPAWDFDPKCNVWSSRAYRPVESCQLPKGSPGIEYICNAQYVEYVEATDPSFLKGLNDCYEVEGAKPIILVCFEDDRQNFAIGERLLEKLEVNDRRWPIFVWIPRQRELSQLLADQRSRRKTSKISYNRRCDLIPFGQCYGSVSYTEVTSSWSEWLARHLHLIWMPKDQKGWDPCIEELQGAILAENVVAAMRSLDWKKLDKVAKSVWEKCDEWERASNRSSAIHSVLKAAAVGQYIEHLGNMAGESPQFSVPPLLDERIRMMEHYRWVSERLIAGWRYDTQRNDIKKTRWQITPWERLDSPPQAEIQKTAAKAGILQEKLKDERIVKMVLGLIRSGRLKVKSIDPKLNAELS